MYSTFGAYQSLQALKDRAWFHTLSQSLVYLLFIAIGVASIPAWANGDQGVSASQVAFSAANHSTGSPFHLLLIAEEEESEDETKQFAALLAESLIVGIEPIASSLPLFTPPPPPIYAKKYLLFHCLKIFC